jgi:MFS family permease
MGKFTSVTGKGLTFILLFWSLWFLIMLVRTILGPILPLIEDEFVISHSKAAILVSCCALGAASSIFASGVFAGRIGYKKTVLACMAVSTTAFLVVPHVKSFSQVAVIMFVLGLATGAYFPCIIPLVTEHYVPSIWGRALAIQDTGASFSLFGAPLLTIGLLHFFSWRHFYSVFAIAYFIAGTLFLFFVKEVKVTRKLTNSLGGVLRNPSMWTISLLWTVATGASMGIYQIIPLYLTKELSFSTQYANMLFGLSRLGGVMFSIAMGFLADRFNPKKSMFVALLLAGIFTMLIGQRNLLVVQIALFLQGTVIMGVFSLGLVAISRMFRMEERSMVSGTMSTVSGVFGFAALPYLLGLAGDYLTFRIGILLFGLVVVLSSSFVFLLKIPQGHHQQGFHH